MSRSQVGSLWQGLRGLLSDNKRTQESREPAIRLAAAILLVEMARADAKYDAKEQEALRRELEQRFSLDSEAARVLVEAARNSADQAVSLHGYIDDINSSLDHSQKKSVLKMLWEVAYADGRLHQNEEHLMRRFADLLHLPHEDFIRLKLQVQGET